MKKIIAVFVSLVAFAGFSSSLMAENIPHHGKKAEKCGAGKCGDGNSSKAEKCGAGKCGG